MKAFSDFHFLSTLQATLNEKGLAEPTAVQAKAIPALLSGHSIVAVAETGGGKTLAYALPILHALKSLETDQVKPNPVRDDGAPRALILVPTRELGEQVAKVFKPFTHTTRVRVRTALGGTDFEVSRRNVDGAHEILVATPGRLTQLLDRQFLTLSDIRTLVFDEADQILDAGFLPDAMKITRACPDDCQKALFSATVTSKVQALMNDLFADAEVFRTRGSHRVVPQLTTKNVTIRDGRRLPVLTELLAKPQQGGTIIFTNTREQCDLLVKDLEKSGVKCAIYRGEMDRVERRRNLKSFRDGVVELLVSTDLASRGLDVPHVGRVINYNMPKQMENYLHRVGRTARAGRAGLVINFITERDLDFLKQIDQVQP